MKEVGLDSKGKVAGRKKMARRRPVKRGDWENMEKREKTANKVSDGTFIIGLEVMKWWGNPSFT